MSEKQGNDFPVTKPIKGSKVVIVSIVMFALMVPIFSWLTKAYADYFSSRGGKSTLAREMNDKRMKAIEAKEQEKKANR